METTIATMLENINWLADKGGPVILVIVALSLLTAAIFVAKLLQFRRLGMFRLTAADPCVDLWEKNDRAGARELIAPQTGCVAETLRAAFARLKGKDANGAAAETETARVANLFLDQAQSGLRLLELIVTAAPLLGLLGTVLGMIEAFQRIAEAESRVDPGILAGGIWEALLTTAAGMVVALIALAALNLLEALVERARRHMEDRATRVLNSQAAA